MNIVVTGSRSGLGLAIATALREAKHVVYDYDIKDGKQFDVANPMVTFASVDAVINCAGINANVWFEDMTSEIWHRVMDTNALGLWKLTQHFLPWLKESKGVVINITSNAAHIPMTSSLAYNASKAAADMVTKQMAHELTPRHGITVFGIAPNKLRGTEMSKQIEENVCAIRGWTSEYAAEYQKKALMKGLETEPSAIADYIVFLLSDERNYTHMSGTIIPFGK